MLKSSLLEAVCALVSSKTIPKGFIATYSRYIHFILYIYTCKFCMFNFSNEHRTANLHSTATTLASFYIFFKPLCTMRD